LGVKIIREDSVRTGRNSDPLGEKENKTWGCRGQQRETEQMGRETSVKKETRDFVKGDGRRLMDNNRGPKQTSKSGEKTYKGKPRENPRG